MILFNQLHIYLKSYLCFVLCCITMDVFAQSHTQEKQFPPEELQKDLQYLKQSLEQNHPNLYVYTRQKELNQVFDSLISSIKAPMTLTTFYKHITFLSSIIKDGHSIILPPEKWVTNQNQHQPFLPLRLIIQEDRLFVQMNNSHYPVMKEGTEILRINTLDAKQIIHEMLSRQVRDGNNSTYPEWILNHYFKEYYGFLYGYPNQFQLIYQQGDSIAEINIAASMKDSIAYYSRLNYPNWNNKIQPGEGLTLRFEENNQYAVLTIKDFHKDVLQQQYEQRFEQLIPAFFKEIESHKTKHLILDLRDNQGGETKYGVLLLTYLLNKPFQYVESYSKRSNDDLPGHLVNASGASTGWHEPVKNPFNGNLYVLINGGSFSNTGIVASCLKREQRAVFIGEETGGNSEVLAGYIKNIQLPNTNIEVQIPTRRFLLTNNPSFLGRGTLPDIKVVAPGIYHQEDKVLLMAIEQMQQH